METHDDFVDSSKLIDDAIYMPFNAESYMVKDSKMANQDDSLTNNLRVDGNMLEKTLGNDDEKDLKKIKQDYKTALIDQ